MNDSRMIGHYRIVERIGSGAMGDVHVGVDTYIDRPVAIKSLRPEYSNDPDFVSRFRAEAASLARLNHPNITTLYSPLFEGSELYMVMELVRGRALDDILRDRGRPLGLKESLAIVAQAADGLSYAHQMGVIHRDIKPSNVMIANDGRVKIMDFGIARVQGSARLTRAGTAVGTPLYMSPEQCKGEEGDERSDLYSLAIVLYEMLSGAPPFTGETEYELIKAQIGAVPAPLIPRVPGVSIEIESAIMTAMSKRPEQRFPNVRAFSDALGATALRIDATSVVRNATHLIEKSEGADDAANPSTGAVDVLRSRVGMASRRVSTLPLGARVAAGLAAIALVTIGLETGGVTHLFEPRSARTDAAAKQSDHGPVMGTATEPSANIPTASANAAIANPTPRPASGLPDLRRAMKDSDFEAAYALAAPLANAGDREAQYHLGILSLKAQGHQDFKAAFKWLQDSAKQGYPDAQAALGQMYQNGDAEGGKNLAEAAHWYSEAAKQNNPKGQYLLASYYLNGWGGLTKDSQKASELYWAASLQNYPGASEAFEKLKKGGRRR